MLTMVIVDDHPAFRAEARALLEREGFVVVGEAWDGRTAVDMIRSVDPDVVLLDIGLPDIDGFEVATQVASEEGDARPHIVLVSSRDIDSYRSRVFPSSVAGCLPKEDVSGDAIRALIRTPDGR